MNGVLVIDKPAGMTSHDVVARVRRVLSERRVGHAGTLDPMATGVLVVMVGEATKLAPYLTRDDKRYLATVQLGVATTTLDIEGEVTARSPLPDWWTAEGERRIEAALGAERSRIEQQPPVFSAIKVAGRSAHARTRAGEDVELTARRVEVRSLVLTGRDVADGRFDLELEVSKGYYVRALARDLGAALGVPAHLCALRRTASGVFDLSQAVALQDVDASRLVSLAEAARLAMPCAELTAVGLERARHGKLLGEEHFLERPVADGWSAWLNAGELVAVGSRRSEGWGVDRGFRGPASQAGERGGSPAKNGP